MRFIKTLKNLFGLPAGYTRLEYLASNGDQYIDTEYVMSDEKTMGFEADMMWTQSHGTANFFYGYRSVNSPVVTGDMRAFFIYGASPDGRLAIRYGVDAENSTQVAVSRNNKCKMTFDGTNLKVNGITYATHSQAYSPADYKSMWLFNCNCEGYYSTDVSHFIGRIYSFKIFEDGVTVRDFVPCLDPFGKPCMYDLIERKAHYNKGTGEFTYGRQIIPVKYLQSSGNQYIDTGIKFDGVNTKIEVKTYEDSLTRQHSICGDDGNFFYYFRGTGNWAVGYNGTASNIDSYMSVGDNVFIIDKNNVYVNDVLAKTYTASSTVSSYNTLLFNRKTSLVDKGAVTIYYCKMWDNDVLVRDYIPAKDENGIGFLFDKVNNSVYLNAGSDAFITGDNIYQPLLRFVVDNDRVVPAGFKEVEYLEFTGTQGIDTGIVGNLDTSYEIIAKTTQTDNTVGVLFGSRSSASSSNISSLYPADGGNIVNDFGDYNSTRQAYLPAGTFPKLKIYNSKNKRSVTNLDTYDYNEITTTYSTAFTTPNNLHIGLKTSGYVTAMVNFSGYVYACKVWDNGTLVRDFIPCLDASNIPCLFDKVTKQAFYNAGTGDFGYGHTITPVEYLQSSGTQYIDTGIIPNQDTKTVLKYQIVRDLTSGFPLFGSRTSVSSNGYSYQRYSSNAMGGQYGAKIIYSSTAPDQNKHVVIRDKNNIYLDDILIATNEIATFTCPGNLYLNAMNNNGTAAIQDCDVKYYSMNMYDGQGNLIKDFIPCKDENNVGYMFDRITHTLYENKGTGSFIIGDTKKELTFRLPKDPIPREYQMVSYLESSGTQYIDTLWHPSSNDLRVNFKVQSMGSPSATAICGAEKNGITPRWVFIMYGQSADATKTYPLTGDWNNNDKGFTFTSGSVLDIDWTTSTSSTTITDKVSNTTYNYTFASNITYSSNDVTLKLFKNGDNQKSSMRMYKYKIWDNNILVRNFVPVIRKLDSVAGMYDIVTKQFFENQGTGTFNYG